ncbi:ABC transporter ATP-binding protein [Actinobaculum suis]|uniref:ABC transporter ATP-binding protein n=1 Tax=Actinobaculum suis TaxID=1657 RepID=UPI0009E1B6A7|nr:ABC transporter ATP-binding protein [Actinobaculum suis]
MAEIENPDNAIEVRNVTKNFKIYKENNKTIKSAIMRGRRSISKEFTALQDVSVNIPRGSTFALVGDNGSGKSTLLKCIAKILVPDNGEIAYDGKIAAMLEVGSGFHPELSGHDNIYLNGSILGMSRKEIDERYEDIVEFSGVRDFIDQPVKNYSSGMYVRLGFSVAIHTEPDILLVDEILAVGDAAFQEKCAKKFADLRARGKTVVVVSHSVPQLRTMADNAVWLEHGKVRMVGPAKVVLEEYSASTHENTRIDALGRVRWGSGDASVVDMQILDANKQRVDRAVATGEKLYIRMFYNARKRIEKPVFGYSMEAIDGTYLWGNNTRDLEFPIDYIEGRGVVDMEIPQLPLQPGQYLFHGSIVNTTTEHVYDYVREMAAISVKRGEPFESGGYLIMDGRWSFPTGSPRGLGNIEFPDVPEDDWRMGPGAETHGEIKMPGQSAPAENDAVAADGKDS